jgi:ribosomal protein S27AE
MEIAEITQIVVRCPYCVLGDEFRPMAAHSNGRFVCNKCGHLAIPSDDHFECVCWKCLELRALDSRRYA